MATTTMRAQVTIEFYTGNLISGNDQETIDSLNFDATVEAYCQQVQRELPEYEIDWQLVRAEGPAMRAIGTDATEEIKENVWWAGERVFNQGEFWINN